MDLKFKTLTFKIRGLSETNRVENHKSIHIYNIYWWQAGKSPFTGFPVDPWVMDFKKAF